MAASYKMNSDSSIAMGPSLKKINEIFGFERMALFACLMSHTVSVKEHCFSLATNQRTVLSAMAFQRSEQGQYSLDRKEGMSLRLKKRAESI